MINKYYLLFVLFCEINLFKHNDTTIKYFLSVLPLIINIIIFLLDKEHLYFQLFTMKQFLLYNYVYN